MNTDLSSGHYAPFLLYAGYYGETGIFSILRHFNFNPPKESGRLKGYAVSKNGKLFRLKLSSKGYNDRFVMHGGAIVLEYVCGMPEERRRQNLNREGDSVMVEISSKEGKEGKEEKELHGVLLGTFLGISMHSECKPDGTEMRVAHSYIRIDGYKQPKGPDVLLSKVSTTVVPVQQKHREHLFFDTESAAPLESRTMARSRAFPMLQCAFLRTNAEFYPLSSGSEYLCYPEQFASSLGNDDRSSILKVGLDVLHSGEDVYHVLSTMFHQLQRCVQSDGFVIAHNVVHDLDQLRATARLVGYEWPSVLELRTIDTVKTACNFVPMEDGDCRWLKLRDLAERAGVVPDGEYHDAATDTRVLWRIVAKYFPEDLLDSCCESYTL